MSKITNQIETVRHSTAHVLAMAVLEMFPDAKFAIGPTIDNGFYYDFDLPRALTTDDLPLLEEKMKTIIATDLKFERSEISAAQAKTDFEKLNQPYKLELIADLEKLGEQISIYQSGTFTDLCAGPHINSTSEIKPDAFKLTKIAGAYWRGDEKNKMLTRVYGVAFANKNELTDYLKMVEEAEKRDHRKLGKELDLFMISEEVGKGLPLWLPNGAFIRHQLEEYMYKKEYALGYKYVYTPVLTHKKLYETSGHLAHYHEDMYSPIDIEGEEYYLRPMNCPHHHMIFNHKPTSYKDLPLRLAEFGLIHRFERSGVLTGLIRARCFTQNDSHIYCRRDQLEDELLGVLKLFKEVYAVFGITDFWFRLSLPDFNNKEKYGDIDKKEVWEAGAEAARQTLDKLGLKYVESQGEASFYGPKIDVQIKNVMGKEDTIATAQIDFYSASRFNLEFTNDKGEKEPVVIIHRAIMGSFDRFFAFLIEHYSGAFPVWLSPVQVKIVSVGEKHIEYCKKLAGELSSHDIRVEVDDSNETVGNKIRKTTAEKIPYALVIGDKEMGSDKLNVRDRGSRETREISKEDFIAEIVSSSRIRGVSSS
jgi:threonyl-tRNA synthetase